MVDIMFCFVCGFLLNFILNLIELFLMFYWILSVWFIGKVLEFWFSVIIVGVCFFFGIECSMVLLLFIYFVSWNLLFVINDCKFVVSFVVFFLVGIDFNKLLI